MRRGRQAIIVYIVQSRITEKLRVVGKIYKQSGTDTDTIDDIGGYIDYNGTLPDEPAEVPLGLPSA